MTVTNVETKGREYLEGLSKSMSEVRINAAAKAYENYKSSASMVMGFSVSDLQVIQTLMKELEMEPKDLIKALEDLANEKVSF